MSYNNYNYSPYFQQGTGHDGRSQHSYPDPNAGSYHRQAYPAVSPNQTAQGHMYTQQPTSMSHTTNAYKSQGYGGVDNGRAENIRGGPYIQSRNPRAAVDTTALGNLAYVSSLGQDSRGQGTVAGANPSMQHIVNYNRTEGRTSFTGSSSNEAVMSSYEHHRSSSGGPVNVAPRGGELQPPQPRMVSYTKYPSTSGIPNVNRGILTPSNDTSGRRILGGSHSADSSENRRPSRQYQQPPWPSSASHSQLSTHSGRSSPTPAPYGNKQSPRLNGATRLSDHPQTYTTQQLPSSSANVTPVPANSQPGAVHPYEQQGLTDGGHSAMPDPPQPHNYQANVQQTNNQQVSHPVPPLSPVTNGHTKDQSPQAANKSSLQSTISVDDQVPRTVDPSQIFNQHEYQRRQVAAATKETPKARVSALVNADPDSIKKAQMELEMKQMIEKMRDYKAKDPSLFSEIWKQVKKGQPPFRASSQPVVQDVTRTESPADVNSSSAMNGKDQSRGPSPTHNQLPLESELAINGSASKPEPDRGRFPAQRRRRGSGKALPNEMADSVLDSAETPTAVQAHRDKKEVVKKSTSVSIDDHEVASGTMQEAMESYHGNLDPRLQTYQSPYQASLQARPEVVHVSGIGPMNPAPSANTNVSSPINTNGEIRKGTSSPAPVANMKSSVPTNGAPNCAESNVTRDPSSGGTVWPEAHKWLLATAASTALTSSPANAGKRLSADEVHQILGRNPSYTELCETLEARGFVIERGPFARTLLAAVPDLGSGRSQAKNETPPQQQPTSQKSPISQQLQTPHHPPISQPPSTPSSFPKSTRPPTFGILVPPEVRNATPAEVQPAAPSVYKNHNITGPDQRNVTGTPNYPVTSLHNIQASPQLPLQQPSQSPMSAPAPRPPTKEEKARKRSFSDIVDLTLSLSDEDDSQRPPKSRRTESWQADDSTLMTANPASTSTPPQSTFPALSVATKSGQIPISSVPRTSELLKTAANKGKSDQSSPADARGNINLSKYKYASLTEPLLSKPSKREHLRSADVVRLMNRRDALRRSSYNPKTICRDILVSSGKHPTMAPLNSHLEILRKSFDNVDNTSDLSTFNWDLVDPGGHAGPFISTAKSINDVEMNEADDEAQPRLSPPASRRRHVAMATTVDGQAPTTAVVAGTKPAEGIFSTRGRRKSRGRVSGTQSMPIEVDASADHLQGKEPEDQHLSRQGAGVGRSGDADQGFLTGGPPNLRRGPAPKSGKKSFLTPTANTVRMQGPGSESDQKPRGRPPGSKHGDIQKSPATPGSTDVSIRARPGSSATDTTPARHSGLRQTMTPADGIAVVIESPMKANDEERKRKSESKDPRKRRKISPVSRHPSIPNHKIYRCQWKRCPSKLHNLETLRKHVRLHRKESPTGAFPCLWAGCGASKVSKSEDGESELQPLEFDTEAGWDQHMEDKHLDCYAWELGDGPSTHPSDAEISDYVSDTQGRQVTPIISPGRGPPDPLPLGTDPKTARTYHKAHGNKTELEKAEAYVAAEKARKWRSRHLGDEEDI